MPYLTLLGMLALWLTPALVARAEEPPSPVPAPPSVASAPVNAPVEVPADYPEDFSQPDEVVATRDNRYEAFGEDDVAEPPRSAPPAAAGLNDPIQ